MDVESTDHILAWQLETSPVMMIWILEIVVETFGLQDILVTDLYNSIWQVGHAPVQTCLQTTRCGQP
jgi:hypothetical protein